MRGKKAHIPSSSFKGGRKSSGLSVVNDALLSSMAVAAPRAETPTKGTSQTVFSSAWGLLLKGKMLDEVVYRLFLQFLPDPNTPAGDVVLCVADNDTVQKLHLTLKLMISTTYFSEKMTKKQVRDNLRGLGGASAVVCDSGSANGVLSDEIKEPARVVSVIHAFTPQQERSAALCRKFSTADHIIIGSQVQHLLSCPRRLAAPAAAQLDRVSARVGIARKIVSLSSGTIANQSSDSNNNSAGISAISHQLMHLRNKLKVRMAENLDLPKWNKVKGCMVAIITSLKNEIRTSRNDNYSKMAILGMVMETSGEGVAHKGADSGRTLACSRWMDGASGREYGASWDVIRYGASCDPVSRNVCSIINEMRKYKLVKLSKRVTTSSPCRMISTAEEIGIFPRKVMQVLQHCKVVGFSWNPNPSGDSDEWGGCFGKACGHNEVAMFFLRPFFPIEVLNTHLCSKASPAPGNFSFDGCLEFLIHQCTWFKKPMHLWDDSCFHYITDQGHHYVKQKRDLLIFSLPKVDFLMKQLRWFCINTPKMGNVDHMITLIDFYLKVSTGKIKLRPDLPTRVSSIIGSFLLCGGRAVWDECG